jgi:hypothetical protein
MYKDDLLQYLDIVMTECGDDLTEHGSEYAEIYAFIESLEDNVYYPKEYVVENIQIMTQTKSESEEVGGVVSDATIEPINKPNVYNGPSKSVQKQEVEQIGNTASPENEPDSVVDEDDTTYTAELTRQFIAGLYDKPRPIAKTFECVLSDFFSGTLVSETFKDELPAFENPEEFSENEERDSTQEEEQC